jgi:hypothetical protein
MERFLLFVALGVSLTFGQGAPAPGLLTGRVVDGTTKEGIRKATVYATGEVSTASQGGGARFQPPTSYSAVTDDSGKFRFSGLAPGVYGLRAERIGYLPPATSRGGGARVAAGEEAKASDIVLNRQGVISGRVTDADGEPVEQASVWAMPVGRGGAAGWRNGMSDDRGEFRIAQLASGAYKLVAIRHENGFATPVVAAGEAVMLYAPTYFPSVLEAASATQVTVGSGEERTGLEIRLRKSVAVRVAGRVTTELAGDAPMSLTLQPYQVGGARGGNFMMNTLGGRSTMASADGRFVIPNVTPGEYILSAGIHRMGTSVSGTMRLRVGQQDVDNVALALHPQARVTGRVVAEGGGNLPFGLVSVGVRGADPAIPAGGGAQVKPDGTFVLENVQRTRMLVTPMAPRGWYLKSVSVGGQPQAGLEFDVTGGDAVVELLYSNRPGKVTGTVEGATEGVRVAAVPDGGETGPVFANLYRTGAVTAGGNSFQIDDVPPGNYLLIACVPGLLEALSEPAVWERVKGKAASVKVEEGGTVTGSPRLITESDLDEK